MAKLSAATNKKFEELSDFISNPDFHAALKKAGKDKQLLRKAKADPKAYFNGEGVPPPPNADVTVSQLEAEGGVKGKVKVTVDVCWVALGFIEVCAQVEIWVEVDSEE